MSVVLWKGGVVKYVCMFIFVRTESGLVNKLWNILIFLQAFHLNVLISKLDLIKLTLCKLKGLKLQQLQHPKSVAPD